MIKLIFMAQTCYSYGNGKTMKEAIKNAKKHAGPGKKKIIAISIYKLRPGADIDKAVLSVNCNSMTMITKNEFVELISTQSL